MLSSLGIATYFPLLLVPPASVLSLPWCLSFNLKKKIKGNDVPVVLSVNPKKTIMSAEPAISEQLSTQANGTSKKGTVNEQLLL